MNAHNAHAVFLEACDIFFLRYHNKPYTLFNPELFRRKVAQRQIPRYLQFAFIATAVRFSSQIQWRQRKQKTIDAYAQASWEMIASSPDGLGDGSDLAVIQALALLAMIDGTAGRRRAAWVKIGMAVRISQDLQMMLEPEDSLPTPEREERRNLFWSLFILDRFVCCSFHRPPAIKMSDCRLKLPVDQPAEGSKVPLTLPELLDEKVRGMPDRVVGLSGLSVGFAALLGLSIDCLMNQESTTVEPWLANSDYSVIYSSLEFLKQLVVRYSAEEGGQSDKSHVVLSLTLYHLSHCILGHPFLLGVKRQAYQHSPTAWVQAQFTSCWNHAQALTTVVVKAKAAGYMLAPSFYSYCILVAGTVHAIHLHGEDKSASELASIYLKTSRAYLSEISEIWHNSYIMSDALRFFTNRCVRYSKILLGPVSRIKDLTATDVTVLRSVLDYWTILDPRNPISELSSLNIDCFADSSMRGENLPLLSRDDTTRSSDSSREENSTVDRDIPVDFPLSIPSRFHWGQGGGDLAPWDLGIHISTKTNADKRPSFFYLHQNLFLNPSLEDEDTMASQTDPTTLKFACSIFAPQLTERVHTYLAENWTFSSDRYRQAFFAMDFPRLVAQLCPTGPLDRLQSSALFVCLTGILDDAFSQMSIEQGQNISRKLLGIMQGSAVPDPPSQLEKIVGDLISDMSSQDETLAKDVIRGAIALFHAQTAKERLSIRHLDEYFEYRFRDVGGEFFTAMVRFVADIHLNENQLGLFREIEKTCVRHMILANDILSWDKEVKQAQESNEEGSVLCSSVPLLARDLGFGFDAAKRVLLVSCRELEVRYRELGDELRQGPGMGADPEIERYIENLGYLASGNEAWSRTTTRYQIRT